MPTHPIDRRMPATSASDGRKAASPGFSSVATTASHWGAGEPVKGFEADDGGDLGSKFNRASKRWFHRLTDFALHPYLRAMSFCVIPPARYSAMRFRHSARISAWLAT